MSIADDMGPDSGGDDIVAAEYVLGVQSGDERTIVASRIDNEQSFARLVDRWEVQFGPLAAGYLAVEPPLAVKPAIDHRLFAGASALGRTTTSRPGLMSSLAFWRGLAIAALAVLALYVALPVINPPARYLPDTLVASLGADGSDVRYLVVYDRLGNDIGLSHVSGPRPQGHDFELWAIEGQQPPVSLGVIPDGSAVRVNVGDAMRAKMTSGTTIAISVEPAGGSLTGQPTGPVVAAGDLRDI